VAGLADAAGLKAPSTPHDRRDLTNGEKAMSIALLYPEEPETGGRGKTGSQSKTAAEIAGVSERRIRQARQVLRFSRDLALTVRDGVTKLHDALQKVKEEKDALSTNEARMAKLRSEAPDLADLVAEDRLKLANGAAAPETRVKDAQRAMATAMIYPEPEKAHRGKKSDQAKKVFATKRLAPRVFRWPAPCSVHLPPIALALTLSLLPRRSRPRARLREVEG
jgi:hypothetical protein